MEPPLDVTDGDNNDITSNDRIIDLVLKGHQVNPYHKDHSNIVLDHLLSSDEDDSILTDSSGPMHNKDLLQELLYSRHKDKNDGSLVVIPAAAFDSDSTASSERSHSPVLEDKEKLWKVAEKEPVCSHSIPVGKNTIGRNTAIYRGLGKQGEMKEKSILTGIGLDRLTKLGRINSAKVLVNHVTITDPSPNSQHDNQPTKNDRYSISYVCLSNDATICFYECDIYSVND